MKNMNLSAPLPFVGQKRMFAKEFIKVLEQFPSKDKPMNILIIPNYVSQMPISLAIFLIKIQKSIYPILQSP